MNYTSITTVLLIGLVCRLALGELPDDVLAPPPPPEIQLPDLLSSNASLAPSTSPSTATTLSPGWQLTPIPPLNDTPAGFVLPLGQAGWYVRGETMFLHLSRNSTQTLAYDLIDATPGLPGGIVQSGPVLTTNNISNNGYNAVPRATLGYRFDENIAVEATYFGRNDWSGSASMASSPSGTPSVIYIESPDTLASDKVSTSLATTLHSAEVNVFEKFENNTQFEFLAGLRYFRLYEQFKFNTERSAAGDLYQSNYNLQTTNNLYGAQIGWRWARSWKRLSVNWLVKTGVYANDASQDQSFGYSKNTSIFSVRNLSDAKPAVSFIQELGLNGVYQVTDSCAIRGGYNLFVMSGLARAGDQIDFSMNPVPSLDAHGTTVLHGPSAGIEFRF